MCDLLQSMSYVSMLIWSKVVLHCILFYQTVKQLWEIMFNSFLSIVFHDWILLLHIFFVNIHLCKLAILKAFLLFPFFGASKLLEGSVSIFWGMVDFPIHYVVPDHVWSFYFFFFSVEYVRFLYKKKKCKDCSSFSEFWG